MADAYSAAQSSGLEFTLFPSFDMTSLPCASAFDAKLLTDYISKYSGHQNSFRRDGKMFVSTFSGENCLFGTSNINDGWTKAVKSSDPVHFMPAFFKDPSEFKNIHVMDGAFSVSH